MAQGLKKMKPTGALGSHKAKKTHAKASSKRHAAKKGSECCPAVLVCVCGGVHLRRRLRCSATHHSREGKLTHPTYPTPPTRTRTRTDPMQLPKNIEMRGLAMEKMVRACVTQRKASHMRYMHGPRLHAPSPRCTSV